MLFGYPIDSFIEITGRAFAKLSGWSPVGKRAVLRVTEGGPGLFGAVVTGTIDRLCPASRDDGARTGALVKLDTPWSSTSQPSKAVQWILAVPRFSGHSAWRLLLSSADVNVFPAGEEGGGQPRWEEMLAICDMRLQSHMPEQIRNSTE